MSVHARLTISADTGLSRTVGVRVVSREPSDTTRLVQLEQPIAVGEYLYVRDADLAWLSDDAPIPTPTNADTLLDALREEHAAHREALAFLNAYADVPRGETTPFDRAHYDELVKRLNAAHDRVEKLQP